MNENDFLMLLLLTPPSEYDAVLAGLWNIATAFEGQGKQVGQIEKNTVE